MAVRLPLTAAIATLLSLLLGACSADAPADPRLEAPLVRVAEARASTVSGRTFSGTVTARVQSDLGFRIAGKVQERLVDAGESVRRGQVLMRLDPDDAQLADRSQQAAVLAASAQAERAIADEVRYRGLRDAGFVSASSYDQAKAAADVARAQLGAQRAQASLSGNAANYTRLVADADGVVIETLAEPGQVVSSGQVVVRIARAGPREARIDLPETMRLEIGRAGVATLFGAESTTAPTKLRQLTDAADPVTRTFDARFTLGEALADAPLGATVTVEIADAGAAPERALEVPLAAVLDTGAGPGVWVVHDTPAKVTWRQVRILQVGDDVANVTGDLRAGDSVVALGAHLLDEGQAVRVETDRAPVVPSVSSSGAAP